MELFVKAGRDDKTLGGCPQCQRVFLALSVKSEYGPLTFSVTPVNLARPPTELRGLFSRLPAIRHNDETLTDVDEMLQYVDKLFPEPSLSYSCGAATQACQDIFSRCVYSSYLLPGVVQRLYLGQQCSHFIYRCRHPLSCRDSFLQPCNVANFTAPADCKCLNPLLVCS